MSFREHLDLAAPFIFGLVVLPMAFGAMALIATCSTRLLNRYLPPEAPCVEEPHQ